MAILNAIGQFLGLIYATLALGLIFGWPYLIPGALLGASYGAIRSVKKHAKPAKYILVGALSGALITWLALGLEAFYLLLQV